MQSAIATKSTKVDLTEDRPITSGSSLFHSLLIVNSTAVDYEVVFNDKDGTEILSIAVPATKSLEYLVSFFADNGLTVVGLRDSGVSVILAYTDDIVPVAASAFIDTKALDFATDEYLLNNTGNSLGIANAWSIQFNIKPVNGADSQYLLRTQPTDGDSTNNSMIRILLEGNVANDPIRILLSNDTNGNSFKDYKYESTFSAGTKVSYIFTWDGTNLKLYVDGVLTDADTKTTDLTASMSEYARRVSIASSNGALTYEGLIHSTSIWNVALIQAEVTALQNGGSPQNFDNRYSSGGYVSSGNLQHYWRCGGDASDIGRDFGNAATLIDIGDNAVNITSDDIVGY